MSASSILLSTAYFAPVHYYARVLHHQAVFIEQFEHFHKQTYRNRAVILGSNGVIPLIIPVEKGRGAKKLIKDLKISYAEDWQHNHWYSIFSAYNSSPFFEFYKDDIKPFFDKKPTYLLDFNTKIHQTICELIGIESKFSFTEDFEDVPHATINLRERITPKIDFRDSDVAFKPKEYTQVFSEKMVFQPNLSTLDLLFNEGANTADILQRCIVE